MRSTTNNYFNNQFICQLFCWLMNDGYEYLNYDSITGLVRNKTENK